MSGTTKHGNSRPARIRRWLEALAQGSTAHIALRIIDGDGVSEQATAVELAVWPLSSDPHAQADAVNAVLQDAADERGRAVRAYVVALDADGNDVATKPVQGRPSKPASPGTVEDLDGTGQGAIAQHQRHYEAMMRIRISESHELRAAFADVLQVQTDIIERLASRLERTEAREEAAREAVRDMQDAWSEALAEADEEQENPEAAKLAMGVMMRLLTGGPQPKKPKEPSQNVDPEPADE